MQNFTLQQHRDSLNEVKLNQIKSYSLSVWDQRDNFITLLKAPNSHFEGETFNEYYSKNINGEKTLTFSIPMYIFNKELGVIEVNERWQLIYNENKVRLTFIYDTGETQIEEFVLKQFVESRNNEEKIAQCECESLAVYELGKVGWGITFDETSISTYEMEQSSNDLLTIDYWMRKIFYFNNKLGRVDTEEEYNYFLQGQQLRNSEGYPIDYGGNVISEPTYASLTDTEKQEYYHPTGWHWEIKSHFENDPNKIGSILYEKPTVNKYIEATPGYYQPFSYQKLIGSEDNTKILRPHPIPSSEMATWTYVTDVKKRIIKCERSNIFSIIQTLCESFEVWAYFTYSYDSLGRIIDRKILLQTEAINDKIKFDFSYGKNLQSCTRTINSEDLITKLYVPDVDSELIEGNVLSIKQAGANPTGEGYIYNFDYFYEKGILSRYSDKGINSDEYAIMQHLIAIKKNNEHITRYQQLLVPLYDRRNVVESQLDIQKASLQALQENIQDIQDKIDAIPTTDQVIRSWALSPQDNNHVGELKTIVYNTATNTATIDFGREDVLYSETVSYTKMTLDSNGNIVTGNTTNVSGYVPRMYLNSSWDKNIAIDEGATTNFAVFNNGATFQPIFSTEPGMGKFIKGIKILDPSVINNKTYGRIRFKYAPLIYYYKQIQNYWTKITSLQNEIANTNAQLTVLNTKINELELSLSKELFVKTNAIHQFERLYYPYIREGYWEPNDYPSNSFSVTLNSTSDYKLYREVLERLSGLNMNDSLHNYSYYYILGLASDIDIDSISMVTTEYSGEEVNIIPRNQYSDYSLFIGRLPFESSSTKKIIIGISPELIDSYVTFNSMTPAPLHPKSFASTITYKDKLGNSHTVEANWSQITIAEGENDPIVVNRYLYITNDNIITSSLVVSGYIEAAKNVLEVNTDYTYAFDTIGYNNFGQEVNLDLQESYNEDLIYDYILKIRIKVTNKTNITFSSWEVSFMEETTLQYFFNDAMATLAKYSIPQVTYEIGVVNLSGLVDFKDYEPEVGQKVPIYDAEMYFNGILGFITEVSYSLQRPQETQITISSFKTKFEDLFQKITAAATTVSFNENEILNAAESFSNGGTTLSGNVFQSTLDNNTYKITMGVNNDITIDKNSGITLTDIDNGSAVKLIGNGIFLTSNINVENPLWTSGITGEGINASAITSGNIDTKNINIWNASEGQIRFVWNEKGIFAYGNTQSPTSQSGSTNPVTAINYNKYVKFSYDGLQFIDKNDSGIEISSVNLGWTGLSISAQSGAVTITGEDGLKVTDSNQVKRIQLGKLSDASYGLIIQGSDGNTVMRTDSSGQLWLKQLLRLGGVISSGGLVQNPDAGIYGGIASDVTYQMGILGPSDTGNWSTTPIRYWAGPLTASQYLQKRYLTKSDLSGSALSVYEQYENDPNKYPAFAQFKVDAEGNIVATGIDVGGWIGQGSFLRSADYESVLRSRNYVEGATQYPIIAIGRYNNETTGLNSNFRVFRDGFVNIGRGAFTVTAAGGVAASNISIGGGPVGGYVLNLGNGSFKVSSTGVLEATGVNISGAINASSGTIGGWNIGTSFPFGLYKTQGGYTTGLNPFVSTSSNIIYAGPTDSPNFIVDGAGNVSFKGDIRGYYDNAWKQGITSTLLTVTLATGTTINCVFVKGLLVGI